MVVVYGGSAQCSRLSPLVVAAVSAAAAAAADDDDGGGGDDDDDDDDDGNENDDNYDDDDDAFFPGLEGRLAHLRTTLLALQVSAEQSVGWMTAMPTSTNPAYCIQIGPKL